LSALPHLYEDTAALPGRSLGDQGVNPKVRFDPKLIADFCARWQIAEFALFGSVIREDFRPDSDVDVLVSFARGARWSLADLVDMEQELAKIFGRRVDLVEKEGLRNPFRRHSILSTREVIYAV
jgi:predicted nucleotidyltransferase